MVRRAALVLVCFVAMDPGKAADCNQNDVPDHEDIQSGTSLDCNANLWPDECDLRAENRWLRADGPVFEDIDPQSLLFADLNDDRHSDAAAVRLGSSSVLVRLRVSWSGVIFEEETRLYEVPPSPGVLLAEDLDADRLKDLVVGHRGTPQISILPGSGGGTFSSPRTLAVGVSPTAILVPDLDGEPGPEVVALGSAPATVSILWNRGSGAFEETLHELGLEAASRRASALAAADLDRDGDRDLIVAGAEDAPAHVLWNLGSRRFRSLETPVRGESVLVLDFDSDGDIDIGASGPVATRLYRNIGAAGFELFGEFFTGRSPGDLARTKWTGRWELGASGDRIGILATTDGITYTPWRIAELEDSGEEIGPFASMVSPPFGSTEAGRVLAAIGSDVRNEASVLTFITSLSARSRDCNLNGIPDECDIASGEEDDCDRDGQADACQYDCNRNGVSDRCDVDRLTSADCNGDRIPDECAVWPGGQEDADRDGIQDHCDLDNPHELRFSGPTNLVLGDGVVQADFAVELVYGATGRAILGLSYGVSAEGCTILGTPGTSPARSRDGSEWPYNDDRCRTYGAHSDPYLLDGNEEVYTSLRLRVACPLDADAPCASGKLRFSPACIYAFGPTDGVIFLEDGPRWPLLTPRSFTICLADFRRGDTNADGKVDISDGIRTIMSLFLGAPPPPCLDAADATDDGALDISDAMRIFMDFFIAQDTNIPPPGPFECGADPSADDLDCHAPEC